MKENNLVQELLNKLCKTLLQLPFYKGSQFYSLLTWIQWNMQSENSLQRNQVDSCDLVIVSELKTYSAPSVVQLLENISSWDGSHWIKLENVGNNGSDIF